MKENSKKTIIKIVIFVSILAIVFYSIKYYIYHSGSRDVQTESAAFNLSSQAITAEFMSNSEAANKKFLDKTVEISGKVSSINGKEVILENSINCNFSQAITYVKVGQMVIIKGRIIGFDDLLGELKLDQCNISE